MKRKFFAIAAMMLLIPMMMGAQALKGSYFLDNSLNRNKLNPAFAPSVGYLQIPVIGNFGVGVMSNLELDSFLYPMNGQLYTFLNKNVSYEQFESALAKNPYLDASVDLNLVNLGFRTGKAFWTVDLGVRVNADVDMPRDLFLFMKKGTGTSGTYNIGQVHANATASVQAAVGYSRDLSDLVKGLRVGGKARLILPVAYAGIDFNNASLAASPDKWTVATDAILRTAGVEMIGAEGNIAPSFNNIGVAGFGFSVDLGAEYKLGFDGFINGLSFSAAVTDLGIISYGSKAQTYTSKGQMDWTGLKISLEEGAMDGAMEDLEAELKNLLNFQKDGKASSFSRSTLPNFYVGAEMPFLDNKMSIGALYSARKSYAGMRNEMTVSYNVKPVEWFSAGINYSFLNVTRTIGAVLELTPKKGTCFFVGLDYIPLSLAKTPDDFFIKKLPMSMRINLELGLAVPFGGKDKKAEKEDK